MNGSALTPARALEAHIEQAIRELTQSTESRQEDEGLVVLGEQHDSYPSLLIHDSNLSDSAKVLFLYLLQEARSRRYGAIVMPSVDETCRVLGHARATVVRDRMLLRIGSWITFCRRVRNPPGTFRDVYSLHSEPCPLVDVVQLDETYMQFVDETASSHNDPYVRRYAVSILDLIERQIRDGRDPLERPDPITRRLEAVQAVKTQSGQFFGGLVPGQGDRVDEATRAGEGGGSPTAGPVQILGRRQGSKFEPRSQVIEKCGSSKFEPPSSSSNHKTTTTSNRTKFELPNTLRWPASFDDNLRRLIYRALCRELPDPEQHQDILDALAHKASDKHHPFRTSPVAYAVKLCRLAKEGKFNPVGPLPATERHPKPNGTNVIDRMREVSRLRNEIAALERLAEGSPSAELRQAIEGQMGQLKEALAELGQSEGQRQC